MVTAVEAPAFLRRDDLDRLIALLREDGRTVIGPTVADGAIVYDEIRSAADLPAGWRDEQEPGRYRLVETDNERTFDFSVGPTSWKRYTFPSRVPIGRAERGADGLSFEPIQPEPPALAFLGVRACELAALRIQDRVLAEGSGRRPGLRGPAQRRSRHRGRVQRGTGDLLLHVDGHRPRGAPATTRTSS